jgi:hypothetical protein
MLLWYLDFLVETTYDYKKKNAATVGAVFYPFSVAIFNILVCAFNFYTLWFAILLGGI